MALIPYPDYKNGSNQRMKKSIDWFSERDFTYFGEVSIRNSRRKKLKKLNEI